MKRLKPLFLAAIIFVPLACLPILSATEPSLNESYSPKSSFTYQSLDVNIGQIVTFNASNSEPGFDGNDLCPIEWYAWNFGDGTTENETDPIIAHFFTEDGEYNITLTVGAPGIPPGIHSTYIDTDVAWHEVVKLSLKGSSIASEEPPIIAWNFTESEGGHYYMTSYIYRIPENFSEYDMYGTKINVHAKSFPGCDQVIFWMKSNGVSHIIEPSGGFSGGGFSVGYGGGAFKVGGSIPYSVVIDEGIGTKQVRIQCTSLYWSQGYDAYVEWHVPEGEQFDWELGCNAQQWLFFGRLWEDRASWDVSQLVSPPTPVISCNGIYEGTMALFNASSSLPGFDGNDNCPITKYTWNFGDGTRLVTTNPAINYTYPALGMYKVTLTVTAPGIGWVHEDYSSSASIGTVVQMVDEVNVDAFVVIENYDGQTGELESRYVCGMGLENTFGGHASFPCLIWLVASVTADGEPVENATVTFEFWDTEGHIWVHPFVTNASGIASDVGAFYMQPGVCWFFVEYEGYQDVVGFGYEYCMLILGYTYDLINIYITNITLVPEGWFANITTVPPTGYYLRRWIINFFWAAHGNPIYIEMNYDYLVVAYFVAKSPGASGGDIKPPMLTKGLY